MPSFASLRYSLRWPPLVSAGLCGAPLASAGLCWPVLACAGVCCPLLVSDGLCCPLSACAGLCWPLLSSAGVCWPVVTVRSSQGSQIIGVSCFRGAAARRRLRRRRSWHLPTQTQRDSHATPSPAAGACASADCTPAV